MANLGKGKNYNATKTKILNTVATKFLKKGYHQTTLREIAEEVNIGYSSLINIFKTKEELLNELVELVINCQFEITEKYLRNVTTNKLYKYAFETTLQLYLAESNESMREMYNVSYTFHHSSLAIFNNISKRLEFIFKEYAPSLTSTDFYELEIAIAGIMRNYLSYPCNMYFSIDKKIQRFIETTFRIYMINEEEIQQTIRFIKGFDFIKISKEAIEYLNTYFKDNI